MEGRACLVPLIWDAPSLRHGDAVETRSRAVGVEAGQGVASEENERPITVGHKSPQAKYAIVFDPLDGSSNIDVAVTIGTTFSIFHRPEGDQADDPAAWVLQRGRKQVAAGFEVIPANGRVVTAELVRRLRDETEDA